MAPSTLPQELVNRIINDELGGGDELLLSACALTSRSLLEAVRSTRFHAIYIASGNSCSSFAQLLEDNDIGSHIRKLVAVNVYNNKPGVYHLSETYDHLATIMDKAYRLQEFSLSFSYKEPHSIDHLPPNLHLALLDLLDLPSLSSLRLMGFDSLPLLYLASCPQLEKLDIHHSRGLVRSCFPLSSSHPCATCQLRSLNIACDICAKSILAVFPLTYLQQLCMRDMSFQNCLALISAAQDSLLNLEIRDITYVPEFVTPIDFCNVVQLTLSVSLLSPHMPEAIKTLTAMVLLLEGGGPSPRLRLESLRLEFTDITRQCEASQILRSGLWRRVETVLQQERYKALKNLCVILEKLDDDSFEGLPDWRPFWWQVPFLWNVGKLCVWWGCEIITPDSSKSDGQVD